MPAGSRPISGLALLSTGPILTFLAVHDTATDGAPRFSIIKFKAGVLFHSYALNYVGGTPPSGFEALESYDDDTFIAVTAGGQYLRYRLKLDTATIEELGTATLPDYASGEIESFAVLQLRAGEGIAIWAIRGGPSDPAEISWAFISDGVIGAVEGTEEFTAPFPASNQRHIAAMRVEQHTGRVFVTSNSDPGDSGPFTSAFYEIGTLAELAGNAVFTLDGSPTEIYRSLNHKAEAIAALPDDQSGLGFILGADNELLGGYVFLQYAPIGRRITVTRTAYSGLSQHDADLKAQALAKREAVAEITCYYRSAQSAAPYCSGDYYEPLERVALSTVSQAAADAAALAEANLAAQEWCEDNFDPEPPPSIDGEAQTVPQPPAEPDIDGLVTDEGDQITTDEGDNMVINE